MMNQRGAITVDYLFTFFLVMGFSLAIVTFSATLSMIEVLQYFAYAGARNFYAANIDENAQKIAAYNKITTLAENPVVSPLLNGGWFEFPMNEVIVDTNIPAKYPDFKDYTPSFEERNLFHGVILTLNAKILDFQVPFFGGTKKSDRDGEKTEGFRTHITSFLGREPSFEECNSFNELRWEKIQQLAVPAGASPYSQANSDDYVAINDNGC